MTLKDKIKRFTTACMAVKLIGGWLGLDEGTQKALEK